MSTKTILKESTTPRCHKLFLSKNYTKNGRANHPRLEIPIDRLLMDGLYLSTTIVVYLSKLVMVGLQEAVVAAFQEVVVVALQEVVVTNP